jgi:hypothetical protein
VLDQVAVVVVFVRIRIMDIIDVAEPSTICTRRNRRKRVVEPGKAVLYISLISARTLSHDFDRAFTVPGRRF